jgi:hypothetical protein
MKQDKYIKSKGYSRIFKSVISKGREIKYFRQFLNGVPIHDWAQYIVDENGNQITNIDILKELDIEEKEIKNKIFFKDESPPF